MIILVRIHVLRQHVNLGAELIHQLQPDCKDEVNSMCAFVERILRDA